jgi:uncharacterized protein (DUF1015 family)
MSKITPFKALRPRAEFAEKVACAPYDVVYPDEVRDLIGKNHLSFLRVTRSEGELGDSPSREEVLQRAQQNLQALIDDGVMVQDDERSIYIYQLRDGDHVQTGVVALCSITEYEQDLIKRHEKTRPDKVEDRTEHMLAVGAQTGLIFLAFRNNKDIRSLIASAVRKEPLYHFSCPQCVEQKVWRISDTDNWVAAFARLNALYVADGHHRIESARLARDRRRAANPDHTGSEQYNFVMAGMFPAEDLRILPYNRVVRDLNGLDRESFFAAIRQNFLLVDTLETAPDERGEIAMYYNRKWYKMKLNSKRARPTDPISRLDVSILQDYLLTPVLGIGDPRTDERIAFVGGARGPEELVRLVDSGEAAVAFAMFPTTMDDLFEVSDAGEIMPPKSTWFEPKLKDGLLVHKI